MLKNNVKIAWRNLLKNKVSSFINIGGLMIGMAVVIFSGLLVWDDLSFNKVYENYDRIVRVQRTQVRDGYKSVSESVPLPLGDLLKTQFEDDFEQVVITRRIEEHIISAGEKNFTARGSFMEAAAPQMFTLKMIYGSHSALRDKNAIILSRSFSRSLFGEENPINQLVKIDNGIEVKVTGVFEDLPKNADFNDMKFIAPFELYASAYGLDPDDWGNANTKIYAQLTGQVSVQKLSERVKLLMRSHVSEKMLTNEPELFLLPMSDWYLHSTFENGVKVMSEQLKLLWLFGTIGAFVLLLACINFINLSTARSEKRAKEVGIRKANGSLRYQLVYQFLSESFLIVSLAFIFSLVLVQLALPWFNSVAERTISIQWTSTAFWVSCLAFVVLTSFIAGAYPAFYLSSFRPIKALKGTFRVGKFAAIPRKVLVVFQFSISIVLILATSIIYRQIQFAKDRPVGYGKDGLLMFQITTSDFNGKISALNTELKNTGLVTEVSLANSSVTGGSDQNNGFEWKGSDAAPEDAIFNIISVTHDYGKTVGWNVAEGRDFSREFATDDEGIIINEAAAKVLNLKQPLGETITGELDYRGKKSFKVLGIVKDMVTQSPFEKVTPSLYFLGGGPWVTMRLDPTASVRQALPAIGAAFEKIAPAVPFDYKFASEDYANKFREEERLGNLATVFAIFAVLISCLGLFGLTLFVAEQRTKEIGIRKVMGASVKSLWIMLTKDFALLVVISLLIASPIAYYLMGDWLTKFDYRTELSWWIFTLAGVGAITITLLTVSLQAVKAALTNPVKSLRSE